MTSALTEAMDLLTQLSTSREFLLYIDPGSTYGKRVLALVARQFEEIDLDQLGHSLAFESCVSLLDSYCLRVGESLGREDWVELPSAPDEVALLADPLKYLDARGLIERHPHNSNWITLRDESEATR